MAYTVENSAGTSLPVKAGSLSFSDTINRRGTMTFVSEVIRFIETESGGYLEAEGGGIIKSVGHNPPIEVGQDIYVKDGATTLWGGTVEEYTETDVTEGSVTHNRFTYRCIDFDHLASRRLVAASYTDMSAGAIVEAVRAEYLADDGITAGGIVEGPKIVSINFNYVTPESVFGELTQITGYTWYIDVDKSLNFLPRDQMLCDWSITDASRPYRSISITKSRSKYRNTQYVRAGFDLTLSRAESKDGDGETRAFLLEYKVGAAPTVTVDTGGGATAKTVGVLGVDLAKQFYYSIGSNVISQDPSETVLLSGHTLEVTYQGQVPILVKVEDEDEIADRAAVETGTGVYESVAQDSTINDDEAATDRALGFLTQFGAIPVVVSYETDTYTTSGCIQTISLTDHGLSGGYLIESVDARDRGDGELRYRVKALSGRAVGGWAEFFRSLIAQGKDFVIRENEVLIILRNTRDTVTVSESAVAATSTGDAVWNTDEWNFSVWG